MKTKVLLLAAAVFALIVAGCGGGDNRVSTVVIQTLSDRAADGDIGFSAPATFSFSQDIVPQPVSLLFGLDAAGTTEFRAFFDFPLDGSGGGGVVPLNATIVSANIEVFINSVSFASTVPTLLDLVTFPIAHLTTADFNSAPLLTRSPFSFVSGDVGNFVRIDVTSLMQEAQRRGVRNFQVRFLLDLVATSGLVEIEDGPSTATAPLLTVEFI